jgi:hypothetical protein
VLVSNKTRPNNHKLDASFRSPYLNIASVEHCDDIHLPSTIEIQAVGDNDAKAEEFDIFTIEVGATD